ncbi:MAG TPA: aldo/keto reductase [Acidimicrobiales bacterium]|nr:aldo/keto reductase [Acidimicrobiales bacterium]
MRPVEAEGVRLFPVGLGTWQFGSREWSYGDTYAAEIAPRVVERSLDLGVNLVDTAEIYAFGRSERIVGAALEGRRDEVFLATKILPVLPVDPVVGMRARGSVRRLRTDHVDLYQLHWPNPVVPARRIADALARLLDAGLTHHVGVSNYPLARWQELERALGRPVLTNQVRYSLVDRAPERDILPWAQENGRVVIAYSPLAQGLLSGHYGPGRRPTGLRARTGPFQPENLERAAPLLEVLHEVAATHRATPSQIALAWLIRRPNVVVIPGASSVEQAEQNAASADIELSAAEDDALTAASDAYQPVRSSVGARAGVVGRRVRRVLDGLRS